MNDSLSLEEMFNCVSDDLFDEAIKYLDFPMGGLEPNNVSGEDLDNLQSLEMTPENVLTSLSSGLNGDFCSDALDKRLSVSACAAEASSQRSIFINGNSAHATELIFSQTSSPISVLESSSSCSAKSHRHLYSKLNFSVKKRARSNKRRPASTFNLHPVSPFSFSSSFAAGESNYVAAYVSELESHYTEKPAKRKQKKKKKLTLLSSADEITWSSLEQQVAARKCMHCEVTKTPQWREGPMGPKTLCNACGVRYRSGRLFPEYRPAASPSFIPSVHSNSHKKVIELRKMGMLETGTTFTRTVFSPPPENMC